MYSLTDIDKQITRINRYISKGTIPFQIASVKLSILSRIKSEIELTGEVSFMARTLAEEHNIRLMKAEKPKQEDRAFSRKNLEAENTDTLGNHIKRRVAHDSENNQCFSTTEMAMDHLTKPKRLKAVCDVDNIRSSTVVNKAYRRWHKMIDACCDASRDAYICEEWLKFSNFLKWYRKHNPKASKKIVAERFNGNLIYSPAHVTLK